jgi:hypothetical protein
MDDCCRLLELDHKPPTSLAVARRFSLVRVAGLTIIDADRGASSTLCRGGGAENGRYAETALMFP